MARVWASDPWLIESVLKKPAVYAEFPMLKPIAEKITTAISASTGCSSCRKRRIARENATLLNDARNIVFSLDQTKIDKLLRLAGLSADCQLCRATRTGHQCIERKDTA